MTYPNAKAEITIELDLSTIASWTDEYLAGAFAAVQVWSSPYGDGWAAEVAGKLRWEILRRWLRDHGPGLYSHQDSGPFRAGLMKIGAKYEPGGAMGTPDWHRGTWSIPTEEQETSA